MSNSCFIDSLNLRVHSAPQGKYQLRCGCSLSSTIHPVFGAREAVQALQLNDKHGCLVVSQLSGACTAPATVSA